MPVVPALPQYAADIDARCWTGYTLGIPEELSMPVKFSDKSAIASDGRRGTGRAMALALAVESGSDGVPARSKVVDGGRLEH